MAKINYEVRGNDGLMYDANGLRTSNQGTTNYLGVQRRADGLYMAAPACHDENFESMGYRNYMPPIHISASMLECAYVATEFYKNKIGNLKDLYKTKENWGRVNCSIPKSFDYEAIGGEVVGSKEKIARRQKANVPAVSITEAMIAANAAYKDAGVKLNASQMKLIRDAIEGQVWHYSVIEDAYAHTRDIIGSMN